MTDKLLMKGRQVTDEWLDSHLQKCVTQIKREIPRFAGHFPSACTTHMQYRIKGNDDWTNGFWTAMVWQAYELTGDAVFKATAQEHLRSFDQRLHEHFVLDHHDIGFLYSLSAFAGYQITQQPSAKQQVLQAADVLMSRYQEKGGFIQAWGGLDDPKEYRLIIDSLLNLPLLFEASRISGDERYQKVGQAHYQKVLANIVRPDYSTYHTFYFDSETGTPVKGMTHQGFSDESCWARGQAWILLGIPLHHRFFPDSDDQALYQKLLTYYFKQLPEDGIPYWDLIFTAQDGEPRDSSAAAIVACGLIEAQKQGYLSNGIELAKGILYELGMYYETQGTEEGLLRHGVYAYAEHKGVDEANLWGDYFYMEALMRLRRRDWKTYW
ncbi:glycoside hydrolase family 88 protein [Latilactobacillus sakei]|uniref:glycoside hydrolase family 88 protein n=1 Tax=Latilactobacillus sakei TaxID=1599 RepID=UPI003F52B199